MKQRKPKKIKPVKKPKRRGFDEDDAMDDFDVPDICLGGPSK